MIDHHADLDNPDAVKELSVVCVQLVIDQHDEA